MSIAEIVSFDKEGNVERFPILKKLFIPLVIILVAGLSFGIGRLSVVGKREAVRIEYDPQLTTYNQQPAINTGQTASVINAIKQDGIVASKNGTKYHFPHCAGAKQIKEENKIVFATPAAAEAAGYTLAANCKLR